MKVCVCSFRVHSGSVESVSTRDTGAGVGFRVYGSYRDNGKENENYYLGFTKIGGTLLGVPILRTVVFWGLYWGPPILGHYQISSTKETAYTRSNDCGQVRDSTH